MTSTPEENEVPEGATFELPEPPSPPALPSAVDILPGRPVTEEEAAEIELSPNCNLCNVHAHGDYAHEDHATSEHDLWVVRIRRGEIPQRNSSYPSAPTE